MYGILEAATCGTVVHCMRIPPQRTAAFYLNVAACLPAPYKTGRDLAFKQKNCCDSLWGMALPVWAAEGRSNLSTTIELPTAASEIGYPFPHISFSISVF